MNIASLNLLIISLNIINQRRLQHIISKFLTCIQFKQFYNQNNIKLNFR
jgi:hypothetical protein